MTTPKPKYIEYREELIQACLALFDENCPRYFALNEREDYQSFLESRPKAYFVGVINDEVVAAYGLIARGSNSKAKLSWMLVSPKFKGEGIGTAMMEHVNYLCRSNNVNEIEIAASHLSCSFFAKFGAIELHSIPNGWGLGMHRVNMLLTI